MSEEIELGLDTLLGVRDELQSDLQDQLLQSCFEIQRKHQFSHDRTLSTVAMERLIDDYVEKLVGDTEKTRS